MAMVETKFKNTDIGVIPEDWEIKSLGDIGEIKMCKRVFSYQTTDQGDIPFFKIGTFGKKPDAYISNKLFYTFREKFSFPKEGEILISASGTIGRTVVYNGEPAYFQDSNIVWIDNNEKIISNKFLYYIYQIVRYKTEGGTIQRLYNNILKNTKFPLPPLPEQKAIAEVLSETDAWIENLENLIAKKQLIKQGAMQSLLTPKEDWEVKRMGELTKVFTKQTGFDYTTYIKPVLVQTKTKKEIPFIQNKDFNNKWINLNTDYYIPVDIAKKFPKILLDEKSLLISISGAIGNVGVYDKECLAFIGGAVAILKFTNIEFIDWVMYYLKSDEGQSKLIGNVKAGSHKNLILDDIRKIEVPLPKLSEQNHITTILSDMDAEMENLEKKLIKAKQVKQGMMQQLLTGKIRLVETKVEETKPIKKRNDHFNDAVLIGALTSCFASEQYPMTRFKYTKVSYLFKRYKEEQTAGYLKKAAGPYKPETRYGGAEKIAITNKYVAIKKSIYKGKQYEGFVNSTNIQEAIDYFKKWYSEEELQWVNRFKFETNDNLELWATVDMAIQDLKNEYKPINLETVKEVIKNNKEWKDKLKRTIFSDNNIENAIARLETLYI